ncbi:hypothetical protein ABW19_dt0209260 [Dactylella cylindrospora]|nr:hypothetical protein ABW19_dt0209260 [Dactylella cylindrospora]
MPPQNPPQQIYKKPSIQAIFQYDIFQLPLEIHYLILEQADLDQHPTLKLVCKIWYEILENHFPLGRYVQVGWFRDWCKPWTSGYIHCSEKKSAPFLLHRGLFMYSMANIDGILIRNQNLATRLERSKHKKCIQWRNQVGKKDDDLVTRVDEDSTRMLLSGSRDISHYFSDQLYIVDYTQSTIEYSKSALKAAFPPMTLGDWFEEVALKAEFRNTMPGVFHTQITPLLPKGKRGCEISCIFIHTVPGCEWSEENNGIRKLVSLTRPRITRGLLQ